MDSVATTTEPAAAVQELMARPGKYLTFHLGAESYGIHILKVQEIIGVMSITTMPNMPDYIRGVINLRGKVIPVISLRARFAMEPRADTERTCIIVVQVTEGNQDVTKSIIVDEVREVQEIGADEIGPPPELGGAGTRFLLGVGQLDQQVVMLLDIETVLSGEGLAEIRQTRQNRGCMDEMDTEA